VRGRNWTRFASALGVPAPALRERVLSLADKAPQAVSDAIRALPARRRRQPELRLLTARVRLLSDLTLRDIDDLSSGRRAGPSGSETLAGEPA